MKVTELLTEAYTPPTKNPKLGFRNKGEKVSVGKQGIPIGGTKEWLKTFGATDQHIEQALRHLKQSPLVKKLPSLGLFDESTERHMKLGSMMFIGTIGEGMKGSKPRVRRIKITVQANGKIDETAPNDHHRAPIVSPKPRIVPGDPVNSIVKTVEASLEKVIATMERRRAAEKKLYAAYQQAMKD